MSKIIAISILAVFLALSTSFLVVTLLRANNLSLSLEEKTTALEQTTTQLEQAKKQLEHTELELAQAESTLYWQLYYKEIDLAFKEYKIGKLEETAEENKLLFYHTLGATTEQKYGVAELGDFLSRWRYIEVAYEVDVFDCSDMSAFLECWLEHEGFHTIMVGGDTPWGSGEKHMWLLVETSPNENMPVEAETFSIVYWSNPHFNNYFEYERRFETIQGALRFFPTEFDWWNARRH